MAASGPIAMVRAWSVNPHVDVMPRVVTNRVFTALIASGLLVSAAGCGRVVFRPDQTAQNAPVSPQVQQQLAQRQTQYQQRADNLDKDNQELESLLAQSRQQVQLLRDQITVTQEQLRGTAEQLAASQQDNSQLKDRTQAMVASVQQPFSATIPASNTLLRPLSSANMPGVNVRQDGDVIRVALAADQLFVPGTSQVRAGGDQMVRQVAADLLRTYPDQIIGIEGHTDGAPLSSPQYPTSHHLSVAQATSVYDLLRQMTGAPAEQLFLIGHGANHPLVSNGTQQGRQKNRRIEMVIYPETIKRR